MKFRVVQTTLQNCEVLRTKDEGKKILLCREKYCGLQTPDYRLQTPDSGLRTSSFIPGTPDFALYLGILNDTYCAAYPPKYPNALLEILLITVVGVEKGLPIL